MLCRQAGAFRRITVTAGLGPNWAAREMRHTFVSVLSASGIPVESIAQLVGRRGHGQELRVVNRQCRDKGQAIQSSAACEPSLIPGGRRSGRPLAVVGLEPSIVGWVDSCLPTAKVLGSL